MSAIQITQYNIDSILDKHYDILLEQADELYLKKHFRIQSSYNEDTVLNSILIKGALSNNNSSVVKFMNKKIRGVLGNDNIQVVDLMTLQTSKRDITNNYYTVNPPFSWEDTISW